MMARAPKHCAHAGCTNLVPGGTRNCADHKSRWPTGQRTKRTKTSQHIAWRNQVLDNANGRCQIRYAGVCTGIATEADHIVPITEGGAEFDPLNGQGACRACHALKSSDEGHRAQGHRTTVRTRAR